MSLDAKSKQANFLPSQYLLDAQYPINHNYLKEQFFDYREILGKIEEVVLRGDFTLGAAVNEFEESFSRIQNAKFSIGVGSVSGRVLSRILELSSHYSTTPNYQLLLFFLKYLGLLSS